MRNSACDFNKLRVMQFVFPIRDASQTKNVIKKHTRGANSDCAVTAVRAAHLAHGLAWHRVAPFGAVFRMVFLGNQHVKTAGFGLIVGFTNSSSLSSQLPFDIRLFLDKDESPGCRPPRCFSFPSPLCFRALPQEPKLARGWWHLCGRSQRGSWGSVGGGRKPFQRQPAFLGASDLNSQT